MRASLGDAVKSVSIHPDNAELAIVVIERPGQATEVLGIPTSTNTRNMRKTFDGAGSFSDTTSLERAASFDPKTLNDAGGPKLLKKGALTA